MKIESNEITNTTTTQNIVNAVNQYINDIMSEFDNPTAIVITSIKVDIKNNKAYVIYTDYSKEMKRIQELITNAITIKTEIGTEKSSDTPDETKLVVLYGELSSIDKEYYEIMTNMGNPQHIYEVI